MLKCCTCKNKKEKDEFYRLHGGYTPQCKECFIGKKRKRERTPRGLLRKIFAQQKRSSKERGHTLPVYTIDELRERYIGHPYFVSLYNNWVESDYNSKLIPSFDRVDDTLGYSFDNIVVSTWGENNKKSHVYLQRYNEARKK